MDKERALHYALRRLSQSMLTKKQLNDLLRKKEVAEADRREIIEKIEGYGFLNDKLWAEGFTRGQIRKGVGPHLLRYKFREKGIPPEIAAPFLEVAEEAQAEAIAAYLQKKKVDLSDFKSRQKAAAALHRKGFDGEAIQNAIRNWDYE